MAHTLIIGLVALFYLYIKRKIKKKPFFPLAIKKCLYGYKLRFKLKKLGHKFAFSNMEYFYSDNIDGSPVYLYIIKSGRKNYTVNINSNINRALSANFETACIELLKTLDKVISSQELGLKIIPKIVRNEKLHKLDFTKSNKFWSVFLRDREQYFIPEGEPVGTKETTMIVDAFTENLSVIYVIPDPQGFSEMEVLSYIDLQRLNINRDELEAIALNSLVDYTLQENFKIHPLSETQNFLAFSVDQTFESSMLLNPTIQGYVKRAFGNSFSAYIPNHEVLMFSKERTEGESSAYECAKEFIDHEKFHPLFGRELRFEDGVWSEGDRIVDKYL